MSDSWDTEDQFAAGIAKLDAFMRRLEGRNLSSRRTATGGLHGRL